MEEEKDVFYLAYENVLLLNGYRLTVSIEEVVDWILKLSKGLSLEALADRFRAYMVEV